MSQINQSIEVDEEVVIDTGHLLELTDRSHCLNMMFENLVAEHPAAKLVAGDIEAVRVAINDLYQNIAAIHCNHAEAAEKGVGNEPATSV